MTIDVAPRWAPTFITGLLYIVDYISPHVGRQNVLQQFTSMTIDVAPHWAPKFITGLLYIVDYISPLSGVKLYFYNRLSVINFVDSLAASLRR
jgi:hypothetical protein